MVLSSSSLHSNFVIILIKSKLKKKARGVKTLETSGCKRAVRYLPSPNPRYRFYGKWIKSHPNRTTLSNLVSSRFKLCLVDSWSFICPLFFQVDNMLITATLMFASFIALLCEGMPPSNSDKEAIGYLNFESLPPKKILPKRCLIRNICLYENPLPGACELQLWEATGWFCYDRVVNLCLGGIFLYGSFDVEHFETSAADGWL